MFGVVKVIKSTGDKLYAKWIGYDNSFNSWIDEKDIVYWRNATGVDKFAKRVDWVSWKSDVCIFDIDKLRNVRTNLNK